MSASAPSPRGGPAPGPSARAYRTHTCGELRKEHVGREVSVCGAVDAAVDGATYDLRDGAGKTRVRLGAKALGFLTEQLTKPGVAGSPTAPTLESVLWVSGKVAARAEPDGANPTGEVEVAAEAIGVLSPAKSPLLFDWRSEAVPRYDRLRHRYLYLRKPAVHEAFRLRTKVLAELRRHLETKRFEEVVTPLLSNRWTADTPESFLAIRARGQMFALPGRRPVHGPLLMAGGLDRTFEIARRFQRKTSYGPFEQPEYTVLDTLMAYVGEEDLLSLVDDLLAHVWKAALGQELALPLPRVTFEEAWRRYGTDTPDLRFSLEIEDLTPLGLEAGAAEFVQVLASGGGLRAIKVSGGVKGGAEKSMAALAAKLEEGGAARLGFVRAGPAGDATAGGPVALAPGFAVRVAKALKLQPGDLGVLVLAKKAGFAAVAAGQVRAALGALPAMKKKPHGVIVVTRIPYFRYDVAAGRWVLSGDPLARPVEKDLEDDQHRMRAQRFEVILDGVAVGGGSVRNTDPALQKRVFAALALSGAEVDARFGQLLRALRFGVPPHGRVTFGVDRLVALALGRDGIDEVIPLPKLPDGVDPLARSPWPVPLGVIPGLLGQ